MSTTPTSIPTHPRLTREDVLDGRDVAELLHLPTSTVLEYARRGLLPGRKLGRRWIFLRDEVEATVRSQPRNRAAA
jgi:excisionase family DNA binding protein